MLWCSWSCLCRTVSSLRWQTWCWWCGWCPGCCRSRSWRQSSHPGRSFLARLHQCTHSWICWYCRGKICCNHRRMQDKQLKTKWILPAKYYKRGNVLVKVPIYDMNSLLPSKQWINDWRPRAGRYVSVLFFIRTWVDLTNWKYLLTASNVCQREMTRPTR